MLVTVKRSTQHGMAIKYHTISTSLSSPWQPYLDCSWMVISLWRDPEDLHLLVITDDDANDDNGAEVGGEEERKRERRWWWGKKTS